MGLAWEPWPLPPLGASAGADLPLPNLRGEPFANHDCAGIASPILDWDALREGLRTSCGHTRETKTLHCAAHIEGWEAHVLPFLRLHQPGDSVRPGSFPSALHFRPFERLEAAAAAECPLGVLTLGIARTIFCARAQDVACYLRHTAIVSKQLYDLPLTVVMGTAWPLFALLNSHDWSWPGIPAGRDYDCERSNRTTADWPAMRRALWVDPARPSASWWLDSLRFVFSNKLAFDLYRGSRECLYGVYVMNTVKAMWAADTESSSYYVYAPYVQWVLYESLHLLGASNWRLFALLHHFTSLRRHGFRLDFTARELGGLPFREQGEWLQAQPLVEHVGLLGLFDTWRSPFAAAAAALRSALAAGGGRRFAYVTMVYGHMNRFIEGWSQRVRTLGVRNLVMATLDEEAYALCSEHHGSQCVRGSISVLNKYTLLLIALQMGIDVMWLDFDIFLVRDPSAAVDRAVEGHDIVIGYDYDSDCICNGFFYLRARPEAHRWLWELLRWLYDHPYEHDQRAISAFLNYTERIAAKPGELPPVPPWNAFDPDNEFINWNSWEGQYEELQLVHFVDGSAFSLYGRPSWDPSIPEAKRRDAEQREGVHAPAADEEQGAEAPKQLTPMEAFYGAAGAVRAEPQDLWAVAPELRQLLDAQRKPKPKVRQRCGILPSVLSAHSGYGWLAGNTAPPLEDEAAALAGQ